MFERHVPLFRSGDFLAIAEEIVFPLVVVSEGEFQLRLCCDDFVSGAKRIMDFAARVGATDFGWEFLGSHARPGGGLVVDIRWTHRFPNGETAFSDTVRYFCTARSDGRPWIQMIEFLDREIPERFEELAEAQGVAH